MNRSATRCCYRWMHDVDMEVQTSKTVQRVQRQVAEDSLRRCSQADVKDVSFTYSLDRDPVTIPAAVLKFVVLCVLFKLDNPRKCRAAFQNEWIPEAVLEWLVFSSLEELASNARMGWIPPKLLLDSLCQHAGRLLIKLA